MRAALKWLVMLGALATAAGCMRASSVRPSHPGNSHPGFEARQGFEAREDQPAEYQRWFLDQRLPRGMQQLPMDRYFAAETRMRTMPHHGLDLRHRTATHARFTAGLGAAASVTPDSASPPEWESLGPDNVAGRVRTLAFDPRDPRRMYAGGVSGGVWLSEDAGAHWQPLSDDAVNINIGALVIDPEHPDTIYAGTGELYRNTERPYSAMAGAGILKSSDGGITWNRLIATAGDDFRYVSDIVLSPHDSRRLYAATNTGVWRSDDAGASFTQVLRPADNDGDLRYEGCNDLAIRSDAGGDWVLAACSSRSIDDRYYLPGTVLPPACNGPCPAGIFLNTDAAGNGTWNQVLSEPGQGRTEMSIHAADPRVIYAAAASIEPGFDRNGDGIGDYQNGLHAVYRSDDGGRHWQAQVRNSTADALSSYLFSYADGFEAVRCHFDTVPFIYGAGWYNNAIAADPVDPDVVWVAGMDIYRSDDGAHSFGIASHWFLPDGNSHLVHADQHLLKFAPGFDGTGEQTLFTTNDGGVAVTHNARGGVDHGIDAACGPIAATVAWQPLIRNLVTTQFYTGAVFPDGSGYLGGAQDNGTQLGHDSSGSTWRHILGGDGAYVAVDPRNTDVIYASSQYVAIQKSTDGGRTFVPATSGLNDSTLFVMPYLLDPNAPNRLYAGGSRLWRSSNGATNWRAVSATFGGGFDGLVSAIAIADSDSSHVLAGNRRGIWRDANALSSTSDTIWAHVQPRDGWVSSLAFDPDDADVAYATYSTYGGVHVWKSSDMGASWQPLVGEGDGALPDIPVHSIAIDPGDTRHLYLGTDLGVFVSLDGGAHWAVENTGFAHVITETLKVSRPDDPGAVPMLFAFTYGRGVWRVPLTQLTGTPDYAIDATASGMWYDPAQSGQGLQFEVIHSGGVPRLLADWYVYLDGQQVWLSGVGDIDGDHASVTMVITSGADFSPDFDPAAVLRERWGTLDVHFISDSQAHIEWSSDYPGFNDGAMDLVPLSRTADPAGDPAGTQVSACLSGNWYDPAQSGQGFLLEISPDNAGGRRLVASWYTYLDGHQYYLVGTGPVEGDHARVEFEHTSGADFPPAFQSGDVQREDWGSAEFTFDDANHGRVQWTPMLDGFQPGSMPLTRLTRLLGRDCQP